MKRLISALVALAMILSMVPAVFATESGTPGTLSLGENVLVLDGSEFDGKSWTYTATEANYDTHRDTYSDILAAFDFRGN